MKLGLLLGFEGSIANVVAVATAAEAAGVDSIHLVEATSTASVPLSAVAVATSRVSLGTYVVNAYARSPWLTGIMARDIDELSGGRLTLGLGSGNLHMNDWYQGLDSSKPMAKLRDHVEIVRAMSRARAGELVTFDGPEHRSKWRAAGDPVRPSIPVLLAGSGPNMISLAGEVSDGVGGGILVSPDHLRDMIRPTAIAGAGKAGRNPEDLAFPTAAWVSVNQDRDRARAAARFAIVGLFHPVPHPYYDLQLRLQGFAEVADMASELMPAGRTREAMELVGDEVIDALTITGTPEECAAALHRYEGVADEVIALRVPQRDDRPGPAAYDDLLEMVTVAAGYRVSDATAV